MIIKKAVSWIRLSVRIVRQILTGAKQNLFAVISVIKAVCITNKSSKDSCDNVRGLSHYYPDKGELPDKGSFSNEATLDLTIIIPVYNVSAYIQECLDSIASQAVNYSYEIIIIDDGSTDDTLAVVQKYDFKDKIIITQENRGQSIARNRAIDISRGKYLMFVDGDDIMLPGSINRLMDAAIETKSEIAEGNVARFSSEITDEIVRYYSGKNHIESNTKFVLTTYGYSVAKVFRRELWDSLRYPEGYIFEDMITRYILRRKANQVAFVGEVVYGYRYNNSSSSHGQNHLKKLDSIWVLPKIFELVKQENAPRDGIFYLLALNDIGLVNYSTTRPFDSDIKRACFVEMRNQLMTIQDCRPKRMPLMFKLLDRAILENKFEAWEYIAKTVNEYTMLKNWREIN